MNIPAEKELNYTTDMINDNFSNYSAWHNRSMLLSLLLNKKVAGFYPKETFLKEEYEFVRNALFTDPDDQSGWFYHLWLLDQTVKVDNLFVSSWPPNGSNICASDPLVLNQYAFPPGSASGFEGFPIILYFNEGVVGVNSSTVTVECEFTSDTNLVWIPVPANRSGYSTTWFTCLNFSMKDMLPSRHYRGKVSIALSEGIVSSSGVCYSRPFHIEFGVFVSSPVPKLREGLETQRIYWSGENFHATELHSEELDFVNRFCQLRTNGSDKLEKNDMNVDIIAEEISYFRELLAEMECKIGKLTLARLLMAHDALSSTSHDTYDQRTLPYKEILELYSDLMKMDPPHIHYYKDEYSLVFLKQELSDKESLLRYCYQYRDSSSPQNRSFASLRLNGLSLSRIGCIERLLWVQMLDLSENELRSIEGLEAMQLLCCLNLSKNKFSSFSSLEPLRQLKSLQVLDISYNEIGAHPIDTRRYLCTSPLSHTIGSDWKKTQQLGLSDVDISTYWDAFSIFKGANLTQLDIVGNPILDEKFKYFLRKLLPTMKWLDNEKSG
ncbi:OLC1v1017209C3 [Oldenlandia corymbosa var. corymbosa]|nr:OLC1v1017209C3 [Oldenlandia corymbosa var. corymbosa]